MTIKSNILVNQGATFTTTFIITDDNSDVIDLTGYTGNSQIRKHYSSNSYYTFTVSIAEANGEVTLSLTANQSANIEAGRYYYDCLLTSDSNVISRVVEGVVTVLPGVTR